MEEENKSLLDSEQSAHEQKGESVSLFDESENDIIETEGVETAEGFQSYKDEQPEINEEYAKEVRINAAEQNPFIKIEESTEYKKLEKEYKAYRQKKVLSHIDAMILPNVSAGEIKQELAETVRSEKGSVAVFPYTMKQARKELPPIIKISVLINYPFAGADKNSVFAELKGAIKAKVNAAVISINLSSYLSGNSKLVDKELKSYKRFGGKIQIIPLFPAQGLSTEQASKLAALVKANMINRVGVAIDPITPNVDKTADVIKIFYNVLGEQCPVDVYGAVCSAEAAETLFNAGADRVITAEYRALSRQRLDTLDVE